MDDSIETFARIRSSDAKCVAAFDTLKQARAMIARALESEQCGSEARRDALDAAVCAEQGERR